MAFLTLRVYDPLADTVTTSRFQFVDLAGCERMEDAHGQHITMDWSDPSQVTVCPDSTHGKFTPTAWSSFAYHPHIGQTP